MFWKEIATQEYFIQRSSGYTNEEKNTDPKQAKPRGISHHCISLTNDVSNITTYTEKDDYSNNNFMYKTF